ncbi:MAG: hypothetical protein JWP81_2176 [Ferruginibacter sp.]|nr:hypothetical protein [Ferruginibacter sp.]
MPMGFINKCVAELILVPELFETLKPSQAQELGAGIPAELPVPVCDFFR